MGVIRSKPELTEFLYFLFFNSLCLLQISAYKLDPRSESSVLRLTVLKLHRKWRGHRSEFSQFLTDKFLALVTHRHRGKKKKKTSSFAVTTEKSRRKQRIQSSDQSLQRWDLDYVFREWWLKHQFTTPVSTLVCCIAKWSLCNDKLAFF